RMRCQREKELLCRLVKVVVILYQELDATYHVGIPSIECCQHLFFGDYIQLVVIFEVGFVDTGNGKASGPYRFLNKITGEAVTQLKMQLFGYLAGEDGAVAAGCVSCV